MAEPLPAAPAIEVGQGQEEVGRRLPLAAEQAGEVIPVRTGLGERGGRDEVVEALRPLGLSGSLASSTTSWRGERKATSDSERSACMRRWSHANSAPPQTHQAAHWAANVTRTFEPLKPRAAGPGGGLGARQERFRRGART
jgi:hypothetical protein